jgi:thymidine kinase
MNKEFPQLEPYNHHVDFLSDWWSENKLFRGSRQSGKTTLMLCEAKRFSDNQFDILFLVPNLKHKRIIIEKYHDLFGERPTFTVKSYYDVRDQKMRGNLFEVFIMDEFQNLDLNNYMMELSVMNPMFVRASACTSNMNSVHYLANEPKMFDSVYDEFGIV